jgi:hypothetical protein
MTTSTTTRRLTSMTLALSGVVATVLLTGSPAMASKKSPDTITVDPHPTYSLAGPIDKVIYP